MVVMVTGMDKRLEKSFLNVLSTLGPLHDPFERGYKAPGMKDLTSHLPDRMGLEAGSI